MEYGHRPTQQFRCENCVRAVRAMIRRPLNYGGSFKSISARFAASGRGERGGWGATHCSSSRCHRRYHMGPLFPRCAWCDPRAGRWRDLAQRTQAASWHPVFQRRVGCSASRHRARTDKGLRIHFRDDARSRTSVSLCKCSARPRELHQRAQAKILHRARSAAQIRCGAARRGRPRQAAWRGRRLRSRQRSRGFNCHGGLRCRSILEPERTRTSITDASGPARYYSAGRHCTCTCGLVAMTLTR